MKIFAAPLQGFTNATFRTIHYNECGRADGYFTPFLRIEHGAPRSRDLADILATANSMVPTVSQVIFRSAAELRELLDTLSKHGVDRVDLNLGCPFPPLVKRGFGSGMLTRPEVFAEASVIIKEFANIKFSIKMRPGVENFNQWKDLLPMINAMNLSFVTIHPRIARQGYSGEVNLECFREMSSAIVHPVVYNGDITTPEQIEQCASAGCHGIMIGRGLLGRPSLIEEWRSGRRWSANERLQSLLRVHNALLEHFASTMTGGEKQIMLKLKPYLEYAEPFFRPRLFKGMKKAASLAAYRDALSEIAQNPLLED